MSENKIVQQRNFETLDDFVTGMNNFWLYFLSNSFLGETAYRTSECFMRFKNDRTKFEKYLTKAVISANEKHKENLRKLKDGTESRIPKLELPHKLLWQAYKIMSQLVYESDKHTTYNGEPDNEYLLR